MDWTDVERPAARLNGFISGFHATQYVYTGVECGLFDALVEPASPRELAAALDLHEPYVKGFCEVGLRWGLLEVVDGAVPDGNGRLQADARFRVREPFVEPLADESSVRYMGDVFRFAAGYNGADYLRYPDYFRTGGRRPYGERDARFSRVIEGSSRGLQTIFVAKLLPERLPQFERRLADGGRLLDVGCGTGHLACALADRYPNLEVVGVDLDADAVARARDAVVEGSVGDRVTVHEADAASYADERGFDAAVSFLSLHEIPPDVRPAVFENLGSLLRGDAALAVFDETYPDAPSGFTEAPYTNGIETQWSELVWGNLVPTPTEHCQLLSLAGLTETTRESFAGRFVLFEGCRDAP